MDLRCARLKYGSGGRAQERICPTWLGDIEVNVTGGYDPNDHRTDDALSSRAEKPLFTTAHASTRSHAAPCLSLARLLVLPRAAFKGPQAISGLGHGNGAHAPTNINFDRESANPKVRGMEGRIGCLTGIPVRICCDESRSKDR